VTASLAEISCTDTVRQSSGAHVADPLKNRLKNPLKTSRNDALSSAILAQIEVRRFLADHWNNAALALCRAALPLAN
jgi:hypothetical protein